LGAENKFYLITMSWDHFQAPSIFSVTYRSTRLNSACFNLEKA